MRYIICYRLHRKNARRKECCRRDFEREKDALTYFENYCKYDKNKNARDFELLTGDWKHIAYYNANGLDTTNYEFVNKYKPVDKFKDSDEIIKLYYGMSESMQKAVKDIMIVTQERREP